MLPERDTTDEEPQRNAGGAARRLSHPRGLTPRRRFPSAGPAGRRRAPVATPGRVPPAP
jgi:hypothetical protein